MTREEFDQLDSNGKHPCPDCGSHRTQPFPGCSCPFVWVKPGIGYTRHINKWHHRCEKPKETAK